ncbi:FtsH protease activity modulator HflK [Thiorhodovibrio frisius]|uniref:Protein HflK n=1 Tax=Thiorhodovibrio frisius TaxID=631362 RepID=H8Z845_9GAMM|nr:FtsH protease activity modulator HflK [Thiorhodovibrio frisius]EIC19980.1 HflK protein [Thiorhodovibrio frisius]WPL20709.1 Modulator of FtsH protease HflK [Thiorhodovibrio frisius]
MAWNEPGGGGKDPWGSQQGNQGGPPDLDEIVRNLQDKMKGLFGGDSGGSGAGGGSGGGSPVGPLGAWAVGIVIGVLLVLWLATGIYIVDPAERGVVLRFGVYERTTQPGPHWHWPWPVEQVEIVNVDEISSFSHKALMLTQDENIVDVELTVQSRIEDASNYLFQDQNPEKTLRDVTETVVRKTIGGSKLDFILTEGRSAVAATIRERVQALIKEYKTGLLVTSINMQPAKPPEQVKEAFDDAIKAREDKERSENQAEAYSNQILPQARGEAARVIADAKAYRDQVIAEAEGESSRFLAVLTEYRKAPEVMRERLYLAAMEDVIGDSQKVLIDVPDSNSLMYLPLDQLMKNTGAGGGKTSTGDLSSASSSDTSSSTAQRPMRNVNRERRTR